ncbi:hypothetical protein RF11_03431 [Thelohanellus kitauei]|uniref:Uncharacterized protein n=1 Tax=Thelohanellus kitauei TaxID=669202 RepID=A0A0C2IMF0_THEKT|nr:hypothetical protein RF11_03431 [Thelohanellus kitauei]
MVSVHSSLLFFSNFIFCLAHSAKSDDVAIDLPNDDSQTETKQRPLEQTTNTNPPPKKTTTTTTTSTGIILTAAHIRKDRYVCRIACIHSRMFPITLTSNGPNQEDISKMEVILSFMDSGPNHINEIMIACNHVITAPCLKEKYEPGSGSWMWITFGVLVVLLVVGGGVLVVYLIRRRSV